MGKCGIMARGSLVLRLLRFFSLALVTSQLQERDHFLPVQSRVRHKFNSMLLPTPRPPAPPDTMVVIVATPIAELR